ncbi:MAG: hypothetical protein KVP17_005065 [Porospora cf. gigantea B]|uniref:uncharacterized protein n=1 Tax=Porospora cf. gigantea B TaxID=2853592 RepID=UPI00357191AF|nr:MAG: hypothetical protein KVP17_005065 [Porospora cf. gigantea B]
MSTPAKPKDVKKVRLVSPVRSERLDDRPPYEPPRPPTPFRCGAPLPDSPLSDSPVAVYRASLKPIQTLKKKSKLRPGARFKLNKILQKKKFRQVEQAEIEPLQAETSPLQSREGSDTYYSAVEALVVSEGEAAECLDPPTPISRRRFCDVSPYEEGIDKRRRRKRRRIESAETASSEGLCTVRHCGQNYSVVEVFEACGAATNEAEAEEERQVNVNLKLKRRVFILTHSTVVVK